MSELERQLVPVVVILITCAGVWLFLQWLWSGSARPDPWGAELDEALQAEELPPTCFHCSATYSPLDRFCPACGSSVGAYNNYSPYLYIFSLGEALREGSFGKLRPDWVSVAGYFLLSLSMSLLAPLYWVQLFKNLARQRQAPAKPPAAPA
jgi:hypothetical protein